MDSTRQSRPRRAFRSARNPDVGVDHLPELLSVVSASGGHDRTAKTEEVEFEKTYKLETTIVPTNRVRARQDWADQVYKTEVAKWRCGQRDR